MSAGATQRWFGGSGALNFELERQATGDAGAPRTPSVPLKQIVEAALLAVGGALSIEQLLALFEEQERPSRAELQAALGALAEDYRERGIELVAVGGGHRVQVRKELAVWVSRLWEEKPARYSRALLETLALIAYRQPITRGEIEQIRGVAVTTQMIKTLTEREWIRVVGHREVPGRPALYATTRHFLEYFGLHSLADLPPLKDLRDPDALGSDALDPDALDPALFDTETPGMLKAPDTPKIAGAGDTAADGADAT